MKTRKKEMITIAVSIIIILIILLLLSAKHSIGGLSGTTQNLMPQHGTNANSSALQFDAISQDAAKTEAFRKAYLDFTIELLKGSREPGATTMISPASVMTALAMTQNGAKGETLSQMEAVLASQMEPDSLNESLLVWIQSLPDEKQAHLAMANSIWVNNRDDCFTPQEEFLRTNAAYYGADIFTASFGQETLNDINFWVKQNTEGMVTNILDRIPEDTVMYLINALAFEGEWETVYESNQVHDASFYSADGKEQTVSMMYSDEYLYLEEDHAAGFMKPYVTGYRFVALLPEDGMTMDAYLDQLNGEIFLHTIENASGTMVSAGLPKFEAKTSLELSQLLTEMGMPMAFDGEQADFSGIGTSSRGNIYISRVLHKTYINVDELGTKAGAATVVEMTGEGAAMDLETVILNRPFLYAIIENETNLPVFIGTAEGF